MNFFLFRVLPGDPARTLGRGRFTTAEQARRSARTYGFDQPLPQQFLTYPARTPSPVTSAISLRYRVPVTELICDRLWPTLLLVGTSTLLAMLIGVWIGIIGAWNRGGSSTASRPAITLTLYSMPEWWLGLLLIAVLAVGIGPFPGIFPTGGLHSTDVDPSSSRGSSTPRGTWCCR